VSVSISRVGCAHLRIWWAQPTLLTTNCCESKKRATSKREVARYYISITDNQLANATFDTLLAFVILIKVGDQGFGRQ
jgi:hypothetical protein